MRIATLLENDRTSHSLRLAVRGNPGYASTVKFLPALSWSELTDRASDGHLDLAVVQANFGMRGPHGEVRIQELERLATHWDPERIILLVGAFSPFPLSTLGRMGFPFVILSGVEDDPGSLVRVPARAQVRSRLRTGLEAPRTPAEEKRIGLLLGLTAGWPPADSVPDEAKRRTTTPRTLRRWVVQEELPSVRRLLAWSRLLEACELCRMEVGNRNTISHLVGASGSDGLAHLARRLAGRPFADLVRFQAEPDPFALFFDEIILPRGQASQTRDPPGDGAAGGPVEDPGDPGKARSA